MDEHETTIEIEDEAVARLVRRAEAGETLVLSSGGRPLAVLTGAGHLKRLNEERALLRRLALGEMESAAGQGDPIERVLEDCRLLLEEN
jgi:prevent-host-death family protein